MDLDVFTGANSDLSDLKRADANTGGSNRILINRALVSAYISWLECAAYSVVNHFCLVVFHDCPTSQLRTVGYHWKGT